MSSAHLLPTIEPTTFDVVLVGTGLPASLIAAAAASNNHTVLHLDPNPYYGSHFSSLPPDSLSSFLLPPLFSHVEVHGCAPEPFRSFLLDASGPRLLYCADPLVDVMLRSGASHHVEFKSVDGTLLYIDGGLSPVPDSREAIFKDKGLGLREKGLMTKFLKMVKAHFEASMNGDLEGKIPEEELEVPFSEFLDKQGLPKKVKLIVLYAIAMAEWDQENPKEHSKLLKAREGLDKLVLYNSSMGRFPNAVGAFIYPIYGQGELPQAFCRCAAVKGALYVLRMPVLDLVVSEESKKYIGVRLSNGQDIYCTQLVLDPSFQSPSLVCPNSSEVCTESTSQEKGDPIKVARMVCITRRSVKSELCNVLVIFPPRSLHPEQTASIRALQLSSNLAVCPHSTFVLYLSTSCQNAILGKELLHSAFNALHMVSAFDPNTSQKNLEEREDSKPDPIWSICYIQEMSPGHYESFFSCSMPDATLDYRALLHTTTKMYQDMYPNESFIVESSSTKTDDEEDLSG